jgi:hypothetical protein
LDEIRAYWRRANEVDRQRYAGRVLATWRMAAGSEQGEWGFAQCWVRQEGGRGELEGVFTLKCDPGGARSWSGYLLKTLDDLYMFGPYPAGPSADWPELVASVKVLLDHRYDFPPDLQVEYRNTDLTSKLKGRRGRST